MALTTAAVSWIVLAGTATVSPDLRSGTPASASSDGREREAAVVVVPPVTAWDGRHGSRRPGSPPVLAFRDDAADEVRSRKASVPGALPGSSPTALPTVPAPTPTPTPGPDRDRGTRRDPQPDRARPERTPPAATPAPTRPQPERDDDRKDDRDEGDRDDRDRGEDRGKDQDRGKDDRDDRDDGDDPAVRSSATPSPHHVPPGHLIGRGHAHHSEDGRGRGHHG